MRWTLGLLLVALGMGSGGCTLLDQVGVLSVPDAGTDGGEIVRPGDTPDGGVDGGSTAAGEDAGLDARQLYCAHPGPAWIVDWKTGVDACGGGVVARTFQHALCSRGSIHASASFTTDMLGDPDAGLASVWTGSDFHSTAPTRLGGSLQVEGPSGVGVATTLSVEGWLLSAGGVSDRPAAVTVARDVQVAGELHLGSLTVGGYVYQPKDQAFEVDAGFPPAQYQQQSVGPFAVVCNTSPLEDIGALVRLNGASNHDGLIELDPGALSGFSEAQRSLSLPCGRFYLRGITGLTGTEEVRLDVQGRTTLFVDGSVDVGGFSVTLAEGAQLDLFIAGDLTPRTWLTLDSNHNPSRLRVYVQNGLSVPRTHLVEAHLYAPNAGLDSAENLELSGSLFVQRLNAAGTFTLHYDEQVLQVGSTCTE